MENVVIRRARKRWKLDASHQFVTTNVRLEFQDDLVESVVQTQKNVMQMASSMQAYMFCLFSMLFVGIYSQDCLGASTLRGYPL